MWKGGGQKVQKMNQMGKLRDGHGAKVAAWHGEYDKARQFSYKENNLYFLKVPHGTIVVGHEGHVSMGIHIHACGWCVWAWVHARV